MCCVADRFPKWNVLIINTLSRPDVRPVQAFKRAAASREDLPKTLRLGEEGTDSCSSGALTSACFQRKCSSEPLTSTIRRVPEVVPRYRVCLTSPICPVGLGRLRVKSSRFDGSSGVVWEEAR